MSDPQKYTVGWICAIATEYLAAQLFLDEEHEGPESVPVNDSNNYTLGKIGKHHVVIAVLPHGEYGISSAAGVIKDMLHSFPNVRISLMVGIGGGAPSSKHDIRLGDVVVSASTNGTGAVFQYDFGKAVQGQEFLQTGFLNQPPTVLRAAVNGLLTRYKRKGHQLDESITNILMENPRLRKEFQRPESGTDRLYQPGKVHPPGDQSCCTTACGSDPSTLVVRVDRTEYEDDPAIHYGPIASSNQLMKDALTRDALAAKKGVLCFEMEAAGLMNHFPCLVIRGICDYSDSHKNKEWQGFAAMMAAAYAKDLLHQIPPNKIEAERPIGEVVGSIQRTLERVISTANQTKDAMAIMTSDSHLAKVERWLSPPDYSTNAKLARNRRHAGTGTWLLDSTAFQEWKLGSRQHLWLYGLAGCGKTILSTTILDNLLQTDSRTTIAFFFDFKDSRKQTLDSLLRSLAFQLYRSGGKAAKELDNFFTSHNNGGRQPDMSALSACIDTMIQSAGKVAVILDALDECTTRVELLRWLRGFTSGKAQLIITGRPEAGFQREIPPLFDEPNCILLNKRAINADIRSFVMAALEQNPDFVSKKLSPDLVDKIRDRVGDGADGMFRWAACQLDSLAECLSPNAIEAALKSLPRDLNETYCRMLENIQPTYKNDAIRLLQFLVHSKRPLKLSEAVEVIATQIDSEPAHFDVGSRLFSEADVLRYCPSLVTIAEVTTHDETTQELYLAHFSVKEYLLGEDQFQITTASISITMTCLTYLTDIREEIIQEFPMARYAAEVWADYAILAQTSEDIARATVRFLEEDATFQRWTRLYQPDGTSDWNAGPQRGSRLYYACFFGLVAPVRDLIGKGADINAQGGFYGNSLQVAADRGNEEIVALLLAKGADINAQGGFHGNALQAAVAGGHERIVTLLLAKGAYVNAQGGNYDNALQAAAAAGHQGIVTLLLANGADVNAQSNRNSGALQVAAGHGHQEIIKLLLANGADVNAEGGFYGDALQTAISLGNKEIVTLLLDNGADINAYRGICGYALQIAVKQGDKEIVTQLLANGADVNAEGGYYGNALQAAACRGDEEMVRLLLANGADINAQGGKHGNALQAAISGGHQEIIALLLAEGAESEDEDEDEDEDEVMY